MNTAIPVNVWDIQASEPYETPEGLRHRDYSNLRLHILAPTMERALELFRAAYPNARLHQAIKRTSVTQVIVDMDAVKGTS